MLERERDPEAQRKSSQRRGAEYTKRLRQRAGTEITGKDKRWIRMARKYPRGEGYKGGRNKSQCRRANLRVLQSTMSRAEESRPLTLTCPGKPVWRPRVILSATASAIWSIKMKHIWHEILPLKEMKERTIYNSLTASKLFSRWDLASSLLQNFWCLRKKLCVSEATLFLSPKVLKWQEAEHPKSLYPGQRCSFTNTPPACYGAPSTTCAQSVNKCDKWGSTARY